MNVLDQIKNLLDKNSINYKVLTHEPVHTSKEAAAIRGVDLSSGAKALVFRSKGEFVMVVIAGDKRVDMKKLKRVLSSQSVSLAHPDEVLEVTHCKIGSVPPFGNLFQIPTFLDRSLFRNEIINFNAGRFDTSITMKIAAFQRAVEPKVVDVAE